MLEIENDKSFACFQSLKYFSSSGPDLFELMLKIEGVKVDKTKLFKNNPTRKYQSKMDNYGIITLHKISLGSVSVYSASTSVFVSELLWVKGRKKILICSLLPTLGSKL